MPALTPDDYNGIAQALTVALQNSGATPRIQPGPGVSPGDQRQAARDYLQYMRDSNKRLSTLATATGRYTDLLRGAVRPVEDVSGKIKELNKRIETTTDSEAKSLLVKERNRLRENNFYKQTAHTVAEFGVNIASTGINLTKAIVNSAASMFATVTNMTAGTEISTAGSVSATFYRTVGAVTEGFGNLITGLSQSLGKIPILGPVMEALGTTVGVATKALGALVGTVLPAILGFFGEQLQKMVNNFQAVNRAGVILTGGLGELKRLAHTSGFNIEQFSQLVKANTEGLTMLGGNVSAGARRFAQINAAMEPYRKQLLNLGFTLEEQAQGIFDFTNNLSLAGEQQKATANDLATRTKEYLVNLRLISAITGEDARQAQKRAQDASRQAAVQAKLAATGGDAEQNFRSLIRVLPGLDKAVSQIYLGGPATGEQGILLSQAPELQAFINKAIAGINSGKDSKTYTDELLVDLQRIAPALQQQLTNVAGPVGTASLFTGKFSELANVISSLSRFVTPVAQNQKPLDELRKDINQAQITPDKPTQDANEIILLMRDMQKKFESMVMDNMPKFTDMIKQSIPVIDNMITAGIDIASKLLPLVNTGVEKFLTFVQDAVPKLHSGLDNLLKEIERLINYYNNTSVGQVVRDSRTEIGTAVGAVGGLVVGRSIGAAAGAGMAAAATAAASRTAITTATRLALTAFAGTVGVLGGPLGAIGGALLGAAAGEWIGNFIADYIVPEPKALGGPVRSSRSYLVGERGPELFVPDKSGTVISNDDLLRMVKGINSLTVDTFDQGPRPGNREQQIYQSKSMNKLMVADFDEGTRPGAREQQIYQSAYEIKNIMQNQLQAQQHSLQLLSDMAITLSNMLSQDGHFYRANRL